MASVVAVLEEIARIQKETAELLRELAVDVHNEAAIQRLSKARDPIQRLAAVPDGPSPQPGPGKWLSRRPGSQSQSARIAEPLTQREQTVLLLLANGLSLQEIGQELYISRNTVKSHTRAIYQKLGVSNRHEAVQRGDELAILPELTSIRGLGRW